MKDNKKKYLIVSIVIAIVAGVAIIFSSTYAYWQLTRKTTPDDVVAMCLDLSIESETGTFGLEKAWPISDEEGKLLEGLTFTVKNNCEKAVNYIVGLNSVQTASNNNYMDYDSIKVMIDNQIPLKYGDLTDVSYSNPEDTAVIRDSRQLSLETIEGGATNTHNVKAWIDINSDVSNQGKTFSGKVFITGGQGILSSDNCFTIAQDGTIWGYNEDCGLNVKVPAEINGIAVKTINRASFNDGILVVVSGYGNKVDGYYENYDAIVVIRDEDDRKLINDDFREQIEYDYMVDNIIVLDDLESYYEYDMSKYNEIYMDVIWLRGSRYNSAKGNIKTLDLSDAIYFEKIETETLTSGGAFEISIDDTCVYQPSGGTPYYYCKGALQELFLPMNGVLHTIEDDAFEDNQLEEVIIPNTITHLSGFDQNNITSLDIPRSVIKLRGFSQNPISEIFIPSNVEEIEYGAFSARGYSSNSVLRTLTFEDTEENPSQLKKIGREAFSFNYLRDIIIPNTVEEIGSYAFHNNEISNLTIVDTLAKPSHLKTIGNNAFSENNLSQVVIPGSVTNIGEAAFYDNNLKTATIKRTEEDAIANMTFGNNWNHAAAIVYNPNYTE